jgi:hypothetical protein
MPKKKRKKKPAGKKKAVRRKKPARKKKAIRRKKLTRHKKSPRGNSQSARLGALEERGSGPESAGQSGDTQGLSRAAGADSESVEELVEEGQAAEAAAISGVENADADEGEVTTKEVPEDDGEYRDRD